MGTSEWSKSEKEIARQAFNLAYIRECKSIEEELRRRVSELQDPKGLWGIHDYLSEKRRDTDRKYDYRYSVLLCSPVFCMKGGSRLRILKGYPSRRLKP